MKIECYAQQDSTTTLKSRIVMIKKNRFNFRAAMVSLAGYAWVTFVLLCVCMLYAAIDIY